MSRNKLLTNIMNGGKGTNKLKSKWKNECRVCISDDDWQNVRTNDLNKQRGKQDSKQSADVWDFSNQQNKCTLHQNKGI